MEEKAALTMQDVTKIAENLKDVKLDGISKSLEEKGIFSGRKVEEYRTMESGGNEKWFNLLFFEVFEQGEEALNRFIEVLKETGYDVIASNLLKQLNLNTSQRQSLSVNSFQNLNVKDELNGSSLSYIDDDVTSDGIFTCCIKSDTPEDEIESGIKYGIIKIKPAKKFFSPRDYRIYQMGSKPKGLALIIVNQDFPGGVYDNRLGAGRDQYNLTHLFNGLGFSVYDYFNKTSGEMKKIIKKFSQLPNHESVDSCVVAISTHGERNRLVGTDNEYVWAEDILDMFNNERCPSLMNKPKLFFFQACRGIKFDSGVSAKNVADGGLSSDSLNKLLKPTDRSPTWTDMVIAYSTIPEYVAIRNVHHGSWFIQALTQVFMDKAWNTPLSEMFLMIAELMSTYETGGGEKQVPEINHRGWKRDLYFNPGLYSP